MKAFQFQKLQQHDISYIISNPQCSNRGRYSKRNQCSCPYKHSSMSSYNTKFQNNIKLKLNQKKKQLSDKSEEELGTDIGKETNNYHSSATFSCSSCPCMSYVLLEISMDWVGGGSISFLSFYVSLSL